VAVAIGALSGVAYILSIAADAPDIDSLKPVDKGAGVAGLRGRRPAPGLHRLDRPAHADSGSHDPGGRQARHRGDRGPALLPARRGRPEGILRAAIRNLGSGKTLQGGSTITQQLVRNLYISPERTFARKIKEAKLAEELESKHSKRWILDTYLNSVSYGTVGGQSAVGLQAASRLFFDKPAKSLTLDEAALLAGASPGALALQPVPRAQARAWPGATTSSARWSSRSSSRRRSSGRRWSSRSGSSRTRTTRRSARTTSSTTSSRS
jgi:penicillin-binding protein 1A